MPVSQTAPNLQTAPGHQLLAAAGKKILRPGGRTATQQLFQWANFKPGDRVLELAASFGHSAIALAKNYGVNVTGIEKNGDSVAIARKNIAAAGVNHLVRVTEGDIFHLDQVAGEFDYVLAEAILTMQAPAGKAKILAGVRDRLKSGGKFLCQELLVRNREAEIRQALSAVIRVNATPLTEIEWIRTCETAGFQVQFHQTGVMGLLQPQQILQDEGWLGTIRIVWNLLSRPQLRARVLSMRQVFQTYQDDLGYIALCAQRL
jgi:predicted O-methyltransferase YrrM